MLTSLILKLSVSGYGTKLDQESRTRCGIVSGITGIICNVILIIIKLVLAIPSGSIAIAADAVNNLSDAGSGIITVAGFHLSSRPPDANMPFSVFEKRPFCSIFDELQQILRQRPVWSVSQKSGH